MCPLPRRSAAAFTLFSAFFLSGSFADGAEEGTGLSNVQYENDLAASAGLAPAAPDCAFVPSYGDPDGRARRADVSRVTLAFAASHPMSTAAGATIADSGVTGRTELRAEDLACTVYSALGIDWTTMRHDDPLGHGFEYVPNAAAGVYAPIDRLFG